MINVKSIAVNFNNGLLLDIGCGSKPYKCFFNVDKYVKELIIIIRKL